jgi:transcription elongation factor GreA
MTKQPMTKAALDRLKAEYEDLSTRGREEMAKRIGSARELGDLSENAEYHAARNDQGLMEARIRELRAQIDNAVEVEDGPELVTVRPTDGGDEEIYLLAPTKHERSQRALRTVTPESPLGQALANGEPGDTVTVQAPGGKFSYEVLKREPWSGD